MKIETLQDLIEWTRKTHKHLAECFRHCGTKQEEQRAKWLLEYLSEHEKVLAQTVDRFENEANAGALRTWVYDYLGHTPVDPHKMCSAPYAQMNFEEISASIFDTHNQIIDLYRYLQGRMDTPRARELVDNLLTLEEHETMLLAQQANRLNDL
jgi:hypothetical protein